MLVSNQAELMYPALEGLGALGCGDSPCAPCMAKKGLRGLGSAPLSTADSTWESWYCQGVAAPYIFPWCVPPTPNVAVLDESVFGSQMTPTNRALATSMAQQLVANDPSLQQDDSSLNWWFIGGGIVLTLFLLK